MKLIKPTAIALFAALGLAGAIAVADAQPQSSNPPGAAEPGPRGPGMGPGGMMGPGDGPGWRGGRMGPDGEMGRGWRYRKYSEEDRAAFLNARIAAVHAGLGLNADQEKLWPPVESAVRDMVKSMSDARDKARDERPKDPIEGMKRRAEMQIARGEATKKVADAAAPLYAALTTEQKERLPRLMRPGMRGHVGRWMRDHGMGWGWGRRDER